MESFTAWAIDTRSTEGHGFIGRYWWFDGQPPVIPTSLEGCRIVLFKTRALARKGLTHVKDSFHDAIEVKVEVTVKPK